MCKQIILLWVFITNKNDALENSSLSKYFNFITMMLEKNY